ncbi:MULTISPECIES: hypothetical protein [Streptomyces]|uniref:hypothetical protein n=1 Tax=Streptomyces TaxID=1883 RepID=UPI0027DA2B8C|nr:MULTISPECIES: hypothetical protein [Streptomyces]
MSTRVVVHRPGQVMVLDSTRLSVLLRETVFGEAVSAMLTVGLGLCAHSLSAFRLTLGSDTSTDVMLPLPMRDGWGR